MPPGVWPHAVLELSEVAGVCLVKVRPRDEGGGLHLALSHILKRIIVGELIKL